MAGTLDVYRLNGLPFELGRYDVQRIGRDAEWARLQAIVQSARESRSPVTGVLLGTYGAGKSFLLWQLANKLQPAKSTHVFAFGPIRLIDPEQKKDFTRSLIVRLFGRGIDIDTQLVPLIRGLSSSKLNAPAALRPFVDLLLALADPKKSVVARRVVTGGRALRKEAQEAGIEETQQIKTPDDAISLLQAFQVVMRAAGVDAVAILIDEVEYVDALPKGQRTAVIDSLKHLWDQEVEFFSRGAEAAQLLMLLSATPNFWQRMRAQVLEEGRRGESAVGITPFFARILPSDIVEMPAELAPNEARELIVNRMTEVRTSSGQKKEEIIPFTDDYVNYVYELSQGLPRRIIEICGVVISEAAKKKLKSIDSTAAKKILRELLISYEPTTLKE